jgi:protein-S-isoprenylcysteine O-methyltransferase Ste14
MDILAIVLQIVFLGSAFGVRTYLHVRKTGSTGFRALGARRSRAEAVGAGGIVVGIAGTLAGALLGLADVLEPLSVADVAWLPWAGAVVAALAIALVLAAQSNMGSSWRIGVDQSESTELVTGGLFSLTRNPIFLGMVLFYAGIALLAPNPLSIASFVVVSAAVEVQVRFVEEPYLIRKHGEAYLSYASRRGRLVPGIGRLRRGP